MPRPPVISLDAVIERSMREQAEDPYRPPTTSPLTQQIERSRPRPANLPGLHFRVNPYAAASTESDEDSDSDDSGLQIKYPSSKRPGDEPRQMVTPTLRRRPNDDERNPQATRGNTLHAERPRRQRNEDIPSQQRPARVPTPDLSEGRRPGDGPRQMMMPRPSRRLNDDGSNPQPTRGNTLHAERPRRLRIEESDSDDGGVVMKDTSSKRPGDRPRQTMTPRPRRRPNAGESNPQPTRGNTLHAERPPRQRNEEIPSERLARIPTSDLLFEGQIPDEPPTPQKPQAARPKPPPPQEEKSRQQPHNDPRPRRPAPVSIADILTRGTTNFQRPQAAQRPSKPASKPQLEETQRPSKPAPKPQPEETQRPSKPAPKPHPQAPEPSSHNPKKPTGLAIPRPLSWGFRAPPKPSKPAPKPQPQPQEPKPSSSSSSSQNPKKPAPVAIPQPLHLGFPRPPRPTQATQLQSATAQGRQPVEEESDDEPILRRRDRRRTTQTQTTVSDHRAGASESDDDIFIFRGDGADGVGGRLSDLKSAGR